MTPQATGTQGRCAVSGRLVAVPRRLLQALRERAVGLLPVRQLTTPGWVASTDTARRDQ